MVLYMAMMTVGRPWAGAFLSFTTRTRTCMGLHADVMLYVLARAALCLREEISHDCYSAIPIAGSDNGVMAKADDDDGGPGGLVHMLLIWIWCVEWLPHKNILQKQPHGNQ